MVRENFALFLRCADGIDTFNEKTLSQSGPGIVDRLNRLDALAESCAHQAKKSFKPLLDNANEVHKVQSALAVLHRVEGVLQAPVCYTSACTNVATVYCRFTSSRQPLTYHSFDLLFCCCSLFIMHSDTVPNAAACRKWSVFSSIESL